MERVKTFWEKHWKTLIFFAGLWTVLLLNSLYTTYPDEFDNILGGKLILHGILPYFGFFSHHGPLAYFLSSLLVLIGGVSFVRFRLLSSLFFLALFGLTYLIWKRRVKNFSGGVALVYIAGAAVAATFFWGQMFLADPLAGLFLVLPYGLLFLKAYWKEKFSSSDLVVISIFTAFSVLTSTTYLYAGIVLYLATAAIYLVQKITFREIVRLLVIFGIPYFIFFVYLLVTGSLKDFYFDAVVYNEKYYIYNYPRPAGSTNFNPLRYAVVITNDFVNNFQMAISGIKDTNLRFPMTHVLVLGNLVLWAYLAVRRRFFLLATSVFLAIFVNARGHPEDIKPTDYQTSVYFLLSLLNGSVALSLIGQEADRIKNLLAKGVVVFLGVALAIYWFFGGMFLSFELWRNVYDRFMGTMPLIYDRPAVAPIVNALVPKDRYCWVGPFEFEEVFYLNCKLPSKYGWILPQFAGIDSIKTELLTQYQNRLPDVIVFRRDFQAFGQSTDYSKFFTEWLDKNYVRLWDMKEFKNYYFVDNHRKDFYLDADFNFEKSKAVALATRLAELGYIKAR